MSTQRDEDPVSEHVPAKTRRVGFCIAIDPNDDEKSIDAITEAVLAAMNAAGLGHLPH